MRGFSLRENVMQQSREPPQRLCEQQRGTLLRGALMAMAAILSASAAVASTYPSKPVRLVSPFAPGGGADIVARTIGQKLQATWGQPLVIDNRGGAGGVVGTEIVARAAPDGYTLLLGTNGGLIINSLIQTRLPYDPFRDFTPISRIVINPQLLVLAPAVPASSVKELVAVLKARPGALNYASVGQGSTTHLSMELFKSMTGTDAVHVPYKGNAPALNDLLTGQVQLMFSNMPAVLPHVKAGRLKGLAVGSARRAIAAPDIPTVAEAGVEGFESVSWFGLFGPAKLPQEIVTTLNKHVVAALNDASVVQRLTAGGAEPSPSTPEELRDHMRREAERWKGVVRAARLRVG
jgi:tripartite-type tricarboxylate transporter receptor subunit TctC